MSKEIIFDGGAFKQEVQNYVALEDWMAACPDEQMFMQAMCIAAARQITGDTSDGYHTFNELYEHRNTLYIALCRELDDRDMGMSKVWRSEFHSDGTRYDGWFLLGINNHPGRQITYHLPMSKWDQCAFATKLDRAPEFDGHTPADVLDRISKL